MANEDGKKDFKESWDHTKEAASDAAEGVKDTAHNAVEGTKDLVDGDDQ